jgi:hypothetical protein
MTHPGQCTATLRSGALCSKAAVPGLSTCASHRPETLARLRDSAKRGGKASGDKREKAAAERAELELLDKGHLLRSGLDLSTSGGMATALDHAAALILRDAPRATARAGAISRLVRDSIALRDSITRDEEVAALADRVEQMVGGPGQRRNGRPAPPRLPQEPTGGDA